VKLASEGLDPVPKGGSVFVPIGTSYTLRLRNLHLWERGGYGSRRRKGRV
jgi:hypothetical protein